MRPMLLRAGFLVCVVPMSLAAVAADYPTKPVRVILGFTAGSGIDIMARAVGQNAARCPGEV